MTKHNLFEPLSHYIVFDLETTGFSSERDEIIEIAALKVCDGVVVEEYSTLVDPGTIIPAEIIRITNITDEMVAGAPKIEDALGGFLSFIGSSPLVGHNIRSFDMRFVQANAERCFGKQIPNEVVDTLHMAKRYLPELKSFTLEALANHYDITYAGAHRALADCHINQLVYEKLLLEAESPSEAALAVPVCPRCGNILKKRNGKFGEFMGCASYPTCRYTRDC